MASAFSGTRLQATTAQDEEVSSPEEIEREIAKLKEDSARDVERQLKEQRMAAKKGQVAEDVKRAVEDAEEGIAPAWRAAEQEVETIVKDAEVGVKKL